MKIKKTLRFYLIITLALCYFPSFAQDSEISWYSSVGLSVGNSAGSTFSRTSYPSIEFGGMKKSTSVGLVLGRSNFADFNKSSASDYWYELKAAISFPIGSASGYALAGIGSYFSTQRAFIEYGLGASYMLNDNWGIFTQASNWDNFWYVTPGLTYNF
ncbi:MAG: hypothetical protein H6607_01285 [Flavobacteriales bacterium]|nr:hypothetical protein [Flavobacteriales bacterium]